MPFKLSDLAEPFEPYVMDSVMNSITPSELFEKHQETIHRLAVKHNTSNPRICGSIVKGMDMPESDIDILVDINKRTETKCGTTLFDLGRLKFDLDKALGVEVEVFTPDDLPKEFKDDVIEMMEPV